MAAASGLVVWATKKSAAATAAEAAAGGREAAEEYDDPLRLRIECVLPGELYIGPAYPATRCAQELKELYKITHILNATKEEPCSKPDWFTYKKVVVLDSPEQDMASHFDETTAFIRDALAKKGNRVYVHCVAGVSRSATFTIAYLMAERGMRLRQALDHVRNVRVCARPNPGFFKQLAAQEQKVFKLEKPSLSTVDYGVWMLRTDFPADTGFTDAELGDAYTAAKENRRVACTKLAKIRAKRLMAAASAGEGKALAAAVAGAGDDADDDVDEDGKKKRKRKVRKPKAQPPVLGADVLGARKKE